MDGGAAERDDIYTDGHTLSLHDALPISLAEYMSALIGEYYLFYHTYKQEYIGDPQLLLH